MNLEIKTDDLKRLEKLQTEIPKMADLVVKSALSKVISYIKNKNKEKIEGIFTAEKELYTGGNFKTKVNSVEAVLLGSKKRNKLENFQISAVKPRRTKNHITTAIRKVKKVAWKTLFWGDYKKGNAKLYIRNGKERHKISVVRTLSAASMSRRGLEELPFDEIQRIFTEELKRGLEKYDY